MLNYAPFWAGHSSKIDLHGYPKEICANMSEAARKLVRLGSETGYEHGVFVDLKSGEIGKSVTDDLSDSVRPDYKYLKENPHVSVAFLHNHNTDTELSFPDVCLIANDNCINIVAAVRKISPISRFADTSMMSLLSNVLRMYLLKASLL